jgi:argininosuccinate synthase
MKLYKGGIAVQGRRSVYSLYNANLATYTVHDTFDHRASAGFIGIYGLPVKTYNEVQRSAAAELSSPAASRAAVPAEAR